MNQQNQKDSTGSKVHVIIYTDRIRFQILEQSKLSELNTHLAPRSVRVYVLANPYLTIADNGSVSLYLRGTVRQDDLFWAEAKFPKNRLTAIQNILRTFKVLGFEIVLEFK